MPVVFLWRKKQRTINGKQNANVVPLKGEQQKQTIKKDVVLLEKEQQKSKKMLFLLKRNSRKSKMLFLLKRNSRKSQKQKIPGNGAKMWSYNKGFFHL